MVFLAKTKGNKYTRLMVNTVIFGIGQFSSKILVFIMLPIYTGYLTTAEYGTVDLIQQSANVLWPVITLGITNGIIRFGLDRSYRKSDVFSTGIKCFLAGYAVFLVLMPVCFAIDFLHDYVMILYIFIITTSMRQICAQFVRARNLIKLYAFEGVLSTFMTCGLTILFLVGFHWGTTGYLLAIIVSDAISIIFLFWMASLWKYVRFGKTRKNTASQMIRYSIPMIPTTVFWWIINVSGRYIVGWFLGTDANGLYAVAYKVPSVVIIVAGIFIDAWQVSAVQENDPRTRGAFFSNVFNALQSIVFATASVLIVSSKLVTNILVSDDFYASWQFMPMLILATTFCTMVNFLGSIYMVEKKSTMTFITTVIGAVANLVLCFVLVPLVGSMFGVYAGVHAAAFASFFSYFLVFVIRAIHTHTLIPIRWNLPKFLLNLVLILVQAVLMIAEVPFWIPIEIGLCAVLVVVNLKSLLETVKHMLKRRRRA